jgi:hypothetical protein
MEGGTLGVGCETNNRNLQRCKEKLQQVHVELVSVLREEGVSQRLVQ